MARPPLSVSNILTMNTALPCLLSVGLALVKAEDDVSEVSDPRLFFANVTSSEFWFQRQDEHVLRILVGLNVIILTESN